METTSESFKHKPKIVILWSVFRSRSTAFEKTFLQRSDTTIIHEPLTSVFYFSQWRRNSYYGDCPEMYNYGWEDVRQRINSQKTPLIFVKEMAFQALPYINKDFLNNVINTFIVRNPRDTIISLYDKTDYFTEEEFGFNQLGEMWKIVTEELGHEPIVVESDRFANHPQEVLSRYCQLIGVEFDPQMLSWKTHKLPLMPYQLKFMSWWDNAQNSTEVIARSQKKDEIRLEHLPMVERAQKIYNQISQLAI